MEGKHPSESAVTDYAYKIFPNDLNDQGTAFGGTIVHLLDRIAVVVAERHSNKSCVTASIDALHFINPASKGDVLIIKSSINRSWTSSMEIGMRVCAEQVYTKKRRHIISAYFTFVALDENRTPVKIPKVIPQNKEEERRFKEAGRRREIRISLSEELKSSRKNFYN